MLKTNNTIIFAASSLVLYDYVHFKIYINQRNHLPALLYVIALKTKSTTQQ